MAAKTDEAHWAQVAQQWIAWARSPEHDAFWAYRDSLVEFLGPGAGNALEIGCGEGCVSRELRKLGYRVTATDAIAVMVDAARQPTRPTNMPSQARAIFHSMINSSIW